MIDVELSYNDLGYELVDLSQSLKRAESGLNDKLIGEPQFDSSLSINLLLYQILKLCLAPTLELGFILTVLYYILPIFGKNSFITLRHLCFHVNDCKIGLFYFVSFMIYFNLSVFRCS